MPYGLKKEYVNNFYVTFLKIGHLECQERNGMMLEQEFSVSEFRDFCQLLCHTATKNRQIMTEILITI